MKKNNNKTQSTGCPQNTVDPESGFVAYYKPDNNCERLSILIKTNEQCIISQRND